MIISDATFTPDGLHRLTLSRIWNEQKGLALYVGLNPSLAGKLANDMTVTKGIGFASRLGLGGTMHGNAYTMISKDPERLFGGTDVIRPESDSALLEMARRARLIVVCWGYFPDFDERFQEVSDLLAPFGPQCFGRTREGYPRHISRLPYATKLEAWRCA